MVRPHVVFRTLRLVHLYVGVFIAPALLFFAFTGALQTFSLHETTPGSSYQPPAWAATLAQIHKKQTPVVPPKRPKPAAAGQSDSPVHDTRPAAHHNAVDPEVTVVEPPVAAHNPLPLKIFFLLVAIGLFTSTVSGIYMSLKYTRNRIAFLLLLLAGAVIPLTMVLV